MDITVNVGGRETRWASVQDARDLVVGLGGAVAAAQKALVEARVMLGHVLRALRGACSLQAWEDFVRSTGLHRKRVTEAMSIAEEFAMPTGAVNWEAYRARCASDAKPSVRAMVAAIAARRAEERAKVMRAAKPAAPGSDAELEADVAEALREAEESMAELELEMALKEAGRSMDELQAEMEQRPGAEAALAVFIEEVEADLEAEAHRSETCATGVAAAGASGKQLTMGPLFEEAWALIERVRSVFARIGVGGMEDALGMLTAKLRSAL